MRFTDGAWVQTAAVRAAIDAHPFLTGLQDGTLPRERFGAYLAQDAHYLLAYARVLALCAAQADDAEDIAFWSAGAHNAIVVERSLHEAHVADFTLVQPSATCTAYTSFLLGLGARGSYPVLTAGVLPCFWIYQDVGTRLIERVGDLSGHPYGDWIGTYGDPAFAAATEQAKDVVDRVAAQAGPSVRERMASAFDTSARFEWMFWDAAWRLESWPL